MVSKMRPDAQGSRMGIVMNGPPLFSGGAGSGESEIRRWLLEQDLIEAIIALPTDIFYNTGIQTYIWLLSNKKIPERRGKVQLIDASGERFWEPTRKSLGAKRRMIPDAARHDIVSIYHDMLNDGSEHSDVSKIFDTTDFGFREIRVERPLRLRFEITKTAMTELAAAAPVAKLDEEARTALLGAVMTACGDGPVMDRADFRTALRAAAKAAGVKIGAPIQKAIENGNLDQGGIYTKREPPEWLVGHADGYGFKLFGPWKQARDIAPPPTNTWTGMASPPANPRSGIGGPTVSVDSRYATVGRRGV